MKGEVGEGGGYGGKSSRGLEVCARREVGGGGGGVGRIGRINWFFRYRGSVFDC